MPDLLTIVCRALEGSGVDWPHGVEVTWGRTATEASAGGAIPVGALWALARGEAETGAILRVRP
jgi:predicted RecA/RadA family phage recombinase